MVSPRGRPVALKRGAETLAVVRPAPARKPAGAEPRHRRRTGILRPDDALARAGDIQRRQRAVTEGLSIGAEMKAGGGPPGAELIGRMDAAQQRLRTIGRITLALLAVSVIAMASARFLY